MDARKRITELEAMLSALNVEKAALKTLTVDEVLAADPVNGSVRWTFRVPDPLARFIAPKGSVAVDGVSLTVNEVRGPEFSVNIIPHTAAVTTFGFLRPGDPVNIEIDTVARYVARLSEYK